MKILIVDDEELTREGIISSINWESLGITRILEAGDGREGLKIACADKPEIILSDVRMPHMDGITMLKELEEKLPDTSVIFMSGYSDREYLKAAIRLKAVSYIDKPIQINEVRDAIRDAISLHQSRIQSHRGREAQDYETGTALARLLTSPPEAGSEEKIRQYAAQLGLSFDDQTSFTSFIVHVSHAGEAWERAQIPVFTGLRAFLDGMGLTCLFLNHRVQYLVYLIIGKKPLPDMLLHAILSYLKSQFESKGSFFLAAGESVQGMENAFHSYTSAAALIQSSFFFPEGSALTASDLVKRERPEDPRDSRFEEAVLIHSRQEAEEFLAALFRHYENSFSDLPNLVRDRYFRLFQLLDDNRQRYQTPSEDGTETIISSIEESFSFRELHDRLAKRTRLFFDAFEAGMNSQENAVIQMIEAYIGQNYMQEGLSVKDISAHVFLSASYVCTVFKSVTGKTLSQYITEYRMEKAKQLLSDPRYKITEISTRVGYSDGNYFGKSFKKYSGMTPSEYRERTMG